MAMEHDVRIADCRLYFLPVRNRVPLRFGRETVEGVTCARAAVEVEDRKGRRFTGWGETPLNAGWLWPGGASHAERDADLREFCRLMARETAGFREWGHAFDLGHLFIGQTLPRLQRERNGGSGNEPIPWLAALACFSPFDIALHDAYAASAGRFVYDVYGPEHMNHDLAWHYGEDEEKDFRGMYPADFLGPMAKILPAWHLVGGGDPLTREDLRGDEPDDGYPVFLEDWIRRDGLTCLKVKLTGAGVAEDIARMRRVGDIGAANGVRHLCADFNCTVEHQSYVTEILERLASESPRLFDMILYLEQPFPRDLRERMLRVESVSSQKLLFMDESAHDWEHVRLGRDLGWTGVALKTCKTQTGALLSLCWAKKRGMEVMVQDLTNPMLAQISHVLLAAHAGTLMGVETNAMQFYPDASALEAAVHPGLYRRRSGAVDLRSLGGPGFGFRIGEIGRGLPESEDTGRTESLLV